MEKKSSIIAIGLTIHNTPVEIREKLAIPEVSILHHAYLRILCRCTLSASDMHSYLGFQGVLVLKLFGCFRLSGPELLRSYARSLTLKRQQSCPLVTEWSCTL